MIIDSIMLRERRSHWAALSMTCCLSATAGWGSAAAVASPAELAAHRVLERVIGASAAQVSMTLTAPTTGLDGAAVEAFTVSGAPGHIAIRATTPSALTAGAGWYLKYVAHADLVLQGRNPVLPAKLPAPANAIRRSASVPNRYALNDTNDAYTDPNLTWDEWQNQLDLMALHGINKVYVSVGTDAIYYRLMQKYGYNAAELRTWIPDPAHQPWWVLQNLSGSESPISAALLARRADLGRKIADRARELGITPVFPGYWGSVPGDFASRNPGADVVAQGTWIGYQRPGWLNPATPLFNRVAADYYALSMQVLGASTMYKMDPLHEGGVQGHVDLTKAASAIDGALQTAHPGATWVLIAWQGNPSQMLLGGVTSKSHLLLLAIEAGGAATWDSGKRWADVPYAFGSLYNYGGHTIIGANATTIVDRWFADLQGGNAARLRGVAIFPEAWTANPVVAELLSELPWQPARYPVKTLPKTGSSARPIEGFLKGWLKDYAVGRYGTTDRHAATAWSILGDTVYAIPPDGDNEAQESLFNAQPSLTVKTAMCCAWAQMRYSGPDLEKAWRELLAAAPSVTQTAAYRFDLTDVTRQVIVNRARVLLPLIRRAYDNKDAARFTALANRWIQLIDLADQAEGTHAAFMLGPRLDNARANASTPAEQTQLIRNAVNLITNWGTRAGYDSGLRDYAHRDWNCLTRTYYKARWTLFFDTLSKQLAGRPAAPIDWYKLGEDFANADHSLCASTPTGDIVRLAGTAKAVLGAGPDASNVPDGWRSYTENDATFDYDADGYTVSSAGANLWQNVNQFGVLYRPGALRDGGSATVRVASLRSEGNRPWARAGILVGGNVVSTQPTGFANIAITPGHGCVFSWAKDSTNGLQDYVESNRVVAPTWVRLTRRGNVYTGACSADGVTWSTVGSGAPGGLAATADVGMFASAVNGGASDRLVAKFDHWTLCASLHCGAP